MHNKAMTDLLVFPGKPLEPNKSRCLLCTPTVPETDAPMLQNCWSQPCYARIVDYVECSIQSQHQRVSVVELCSTHS